MRRQLWAKDGQSSTLIEWWVRRKNTAGLHVRERRCFTDWLDSISRRRRVERLGPAPSRQIPGYLPWDGRDGCPAGKYRHSIRSRSRLVSHSCTLSTPRHCAFSSLPRQFKGPNEEKRVYRWNSRYGCNVLITASRTYEIRIRFPYQCHGNDTREYAGPERDRSGINPSSISLAHGSHPPIRHPLKLCANKAQHFSPVTNVSYHIPTPVSHTPK